MTTKRIHSLFLVLWSSSRRLLLIEHNFALKAVPEFRGLLAFRHSDNRHMLMPATHIQISHRILHRLSFLRLGRPFTNPRKHHSASIQDKRIHRVQLTFIQLPSANFVNLHHSTFITYMMQRQLHTFRHFLLLHFLCDTLWFSAWKIAPKLVNQRISMVFKSVNNKRFLDLTKPRCLQLVHNSIGFTHFPMRCKCAIELKHPQSAVQHKRIRVVQRFMLQRHLVDLDVSFIAANVQQSWFVFLRLNASKSRINAARKNGHFRKQVEKTLAFVALDLSILHRLVIEDLVQFHSFVGSGSGFILRGLCTQPVEHVVG
mmetsp:Transcript_70640/g.112250  ORF Transcript_70640/g.112250 Transcript_70640/m.112250 type:complete len:315 (-) Transcript_70640:268-1212(-)